MKRISTCIAIFILSTIISHNVWAQKFLKGSIVFKDGKVLNGLVQHPKKYNTAKISYKENEAAAEQSFPSEALKTVIINTASKNFEFDFCAHQGGSVDRVSKPRWLVVMVRGPVTLYTVPQKIEIKRDKLTIEYDTFLNYYIKRVSEESAYFIGTYVSNSVSIGAIKDFYKRASEYFKDHPALVKKIQDEGYSIINATTVIEEYNEWVLSKKKK